MKTLLELIRERRTELMAKDLEGVTDEIRIQVMCNIVAAARRNPGGDEATKLQQFAASGPECREMVEDFTKACMEAETALRKLVRDIAGLEASDDREFAEVVRRLVVTSWRHPDRAERLDRFRKSGPAERAVLKECVKAGSYVSRETGPDALSRGLRGMQPEGGARPSASSVPPARAEEPAETLFDLEEPRAVTTSSGTSYLRPVIPGHGRNQSWHKEKPDPFNPGVGWMGRRR
jgi:hypothetical protein